MASEWTPSIKEINGINLTNYFPQKRSFNSIVFVHKKFLEEPKYTESKKEREKPKKLNRNKSDKWQQFSCDKFTEISKDRTYKISNTNNVNNDSVLEQTIRFAKNIVPLTIPPNEDKVPVFYTIKTARKHGKKDKKPQEPRYDHHEGYGRRDSKKVIETYRKVKKDHSSGRESVSHSSSNTLDDLNINQSLCCTFSEMSEKKYHKKEKTIVKKQSDGQKIVVSESFEALATENIGESKLKIHLMNDRDKHFLSDSIKIPVLNAIKDCIAELNTTNLNTDITTVQNYVKCNTQKLDYILDKLTCIEKKLDAQAQEKIVINARAPEKKVSSKAVHAQIEEKKDVPTVQTPSAKASKLEELGEDLIEIKEDYSSEEELHQEWLDRRSKSAVLEIVPEDKSEKNMESLGGGEVARTMRPSSSIAAKLERPNRIPARFCWTDAGRK